MSERLSSGQCLFLELLRFEDKFFVNSDNVLVIRSYGSVDMNSGRRSFNL